MSIIPPVQDPNDPKQVRKQRIKILYAMDLSRKRQDKRLKELQEEMSQLQEVCPHPRTVRHTNDPSIGDATTDECLDCGKQIEV